MMSEEAYFSVQETLTSPKAGCIAGTKKRPHPHMKNKWLRIAKQSARKALWKL